MTPLAMYDDGAQFPPLHQAVITKEQLRLEAVEDPVRYASEYQALWAAVLNAYLKPSHVARIAEPWRSERLTLKSRGRDDIAYVAHADPARSGANFALVVAHEELGDDGENHVVVDVARVWRPRDYPGGEINYVDVENALFDYVKAFQLHELSFDQWNSAGTMDHLRDRVQQAGFPWYTNISQRTATSRSNWAEAENFKTALIKDLVHSPYVELLEQELLSLTWDGHQKVEPPSTGPCTTSDLADCLFAVTHVLLEGRFNPFNDPSMLQVRGMYPGDFPATPKERALFEQLAGGGRRPGGHGAQRQRGESTNPARRLNPRDR